MIAGDTDEFLPGTQPAPKRAPFNSSRAAGGGGSGDHAQLSRKPKQHSPQHRMQNLPQSFINELAQEVQCRRKEREQKKPIGARLDSGRRCGGGRHTGQCTRSGEGAVGTSPHRMGEGGQRDREQDDGGGAPRGTPQRARQCGEGNGRPGAQTTVGLQEAVSVARATLQATRTGNSTHEKPGRRIGSLKTDEGSNGDPDDVSDGLTTSEDETMLTVDRNIKLRKPSELTMMTGEDFERHFLGTQ